MLDTIRGLVRPVVTFAFVGALVAASFVDGGAFERLKDPALMVVAFWFGQRVGGDSAPPVG